MKKVLLTVVVLAVVGLIGWRVHVKMSASGTGAPGAPGFPGSRLSV